MLIPKNMTNLLLYNDLANYTHSCHKLLTIYILSFFLGAYTNTHLSIIKDSLFKI